MDNVTNLNEHKIWSAFEDRLNYAKSIGLDVALTDLMAALSLILCEDKETGLLEYLNKKAESLSNVNNFFLAYERAAIEHSKLLTKLPV